MQLPGAGTGTAHRFGRRIRRACLVAIVIAALPAAPAVALPNTSTPSISLARTIRTTPFVGTTSSMKDGEGSSFVPNDPSHPNKNGTDSLWLIEDNGKSAWEVNPYTGALKSHIAQADWANTLRYGCTATGGSCAAGTNRTLDLESMAYDAATDTLYAFSGKCCSSSVLPTAYRLTRRADGSFYPESFQPLATGSDYTAAAWNPGDRKLYVGVGKNLRTYDYRANAAGPTFQVSGLSGIYGMGFSDGDLFVVNSSEKLLRVDWASRTLRSGWTFDLTKFGVRDSRAVDVIADQFYVLDGYDSRSSGDPLSHAVFVFDVCCGSQTQTASVASFTWAQAPGTTTVQFTDTSTGEPTGWSWDFGDSTTSTNRHPSHPYATDGTFTVQLTASNGGGSSTVTNTITVTAPAPVTTFGPTADSYVALANPDQNYGTGAALRGKLTSTNEMRPYLTFSVSGLQGQTITGATLRLYVTDGSTSGGDWYTVSPDWTESGTGSITWRNAPEILDATKFASVGVVTTGTWLEIDLFGVVTGEDTYGFAMKTSSGDVVYYASRESTNPPELVLTLEP